MNFLDGRIVLHAGDCLDVLGTLEENSIDACITDPPYHLTSMVRRLSRTNGADVEKNFTKTVDGQATNPFASAALGFMGKAWDGGDIAFQSETWAKVFRVMKPGAHLLAFGGTRTFGRMQVAIEDAGFEIRDTIMWLYSTGFPKSHSVTKGAGDAICTCEAAEREMRSVWNADVSSALDVGDERGEVLFTSMSEQDASSNGTTPRQSINGRSHKSSMEGRGDISEQARKLRERPLREMSAGLDFDGESGRLRDGAPPSDGALDQAHAVADRVCSSHRPSTVEQSADEPRTLAGQSQPQERGAWDHCGRCGKPIVLDGLGTALKPSVEPVVLARKPLSEATVAKNVLKWGTGALNIDGCRVSAVSGDEPLSWENSRGMGFSGGKDHGKCAAIKNASGRWPANVIHDGSEEVVVGFPESTATSGPFYRKSTLGVDSVVNIASRKDELAGVGFGDSGSAARYFYSAKADSDDRLGSKHPTIKPVDLIQYLVRLVTPPKGLVLDPFAGSGTTGEAAFREGMRAVLIEREEEYCADVKRRMALVLAGPDERSRESIKASGKTERNPGPLFGDGTQP